MSTTPSPWQQHDPEYCPMEIWGNLDGPLEDGEIHGTHVVEVLTNEDDARLILRCVNSHDGLLAAAVLAEKIVESCWAICRHKSIEPPMHPGVQERIEQQAKEALDALRAAITKAKRY